MSSQLAKLFNQDRAAHWVFLRPAVTDPHIEIVTINIRSAAWFPDNFSAIFNDAIRSTWGCAKSLMPREMWTKTCSDCGQHCACWCSSIVLCDRNPRAQWRHKTRVPWWRHQMETLSALWALCAGNSPVISKFPSQRPVTRSFDVFFDLRLKKRLSKQSKRWWF